MTRIGVGGLMNLEKLRQAHLVLGDIRLFQQHGVTDDDAETM